MELSFFNRSTIFKIKEKLKGINVSITESITKRRVTKVEKAREVYNIRKVWSHGNKNLFLDINGRHMVKVFYN